MSFGLKAQNLTVSGYVVDRENRETIIGATVSVKETAKGVATDVNGYFQITGLSNGNLTLVFNHVSYEPSEKKIVLNNKGLVLEETELEPKVNMLNEISVIQVRPDEVGDKEIETGQVELTPKAIQSIPSARNDVFRAVKYLPGIESAGPFSPLYSVRGGDPGENKVILDGITIYNPYHFNTASGIFNVQTIKNVDMLIGGYGAEFGGSNSSIMYITTKEGNKNELHGELYPSLMQTKLILEFPAGKDASMMIGGRYFYDFQSAFVLYNNSYFYDFNISYSNRLNNKNWLGVKLFYSKDKTTYEFGKFMGYLYKTFDLEVYKNIDMGLDNRWDNLAATVYYKKILTPSVHFNTQIYYSRHSSSNYSYLNMLFELDSSDVNVRLKYNTLFKSRIHDLCGKTVFNIKAGMHNNIQTGFEYNTYLFENAAELNDIDKGSEKRVPDQMNAFIEDKIKLGPVIFRPGIRITKYSLYENIYPEPRINAVIKLSPGFSLKGAYGVYHQYIINMNTQEYEVNQFLDYYYPLKNIKPSKSIHYITGFEQKVSKNLNLNFDLYYKDIVRTYTFDLNQSESETYTFSDRVQEGNGKAYGMEIMLKGNIDRFSGWIGYTLSRSERSFPHIMDGKTFLFDYDRTHSVNLLLNYQVNEKLSYSTTFLLMSGNPRTIETIFQDYFYYDPLTGSLEFYPLSESSYKNNARLPMVMEWDIGLQKRLRTGFGAELQEFLKADESYINFTLGNLMFWRRNVIWYFPTAENKYIPIGTNYIPYVNVGYMLKF